MIQKIALISPLDCFDNFGLRSISAYLKSKGIQTRMIFLPSYSEIWRIVAHQNKKQTYSKQVLKYVQTLVEPCDAIGITMLSADRDRVKTLTDHLKPLGKPVILGGAHPSSNPEDALELADHIIIGEGYEPLYEWCMDPYNLSVENLWIKTGQGIIKNRIRPAMKDLDSLPFPDYGPSGHFIIENETLVPVTYSVLKKYMGRYYSVFTSHGCPFECSFCINSRYKDLGNGYDAFRYHSVDYVIAQLKYCLSLSPDIDYISIADDGFIYHSEEYIEEFSIKYKKEINLPFAVMGIIPSFLTKRKLDLLVKAGMKRTRTGFQSGCKTTLKAYKRPGHISKFHHCHTLLTSYPELVFPYYDFIIDNPLVDTEKDMLASIKLLSELKGRFTLILYSMRMYQGTEIHEQAKAKGVPSHYFNSHYGNYSHSLLTLILMVIQATNSRVLTVMLMKVYKRYGNIKIPGLIIRAWIGVWLVRQGIEHMRKGDGSTLPGLISKWLIRTRRKQYPGRKKRHGDVSGYYEPVK